MLTSILLQFVVGSAQFGLRWTELIIDHQYVVQKNHLYTNVLSLIYLPDVTYMIYVMTHTKYVMCHNSR